MSKEIAIYLEGGGNTSETLAPFRQGMQEFLKTIREEGRKRGIRFRVIPCGGRKEAYDLFCDAVENEPHVFNVLLVDAEEKVTKTPWAHLKARVGDGWETPAGVDDERCHLMIVVMETWFLADPAGVARFYKSKKGFDAGALPKLPPLPKPPKPPTVLENMSKDSVNAVLKKATKDTKDEEYKKIRHGAKLLETVDPNLVRQHCPSCDRLFDALAKAIGIAGCTAYYDHTSH